MYLVRIPRQTDHFYLIVYVANLYRLHERRTEFLKLRYILRKQHIEIIGKSTKTMHKITSVQKIELSIGNQSVICHENHVHIQFIRGSKQDR